MKVRFAQSQAAVAAARERAQRANARARALRTIVLTRSALDRQERDHVRSAWTGAVDDVVRVARERDQAFAVLSHELRQAIGAAVSALRLSRVSPHADTVEKARSVLERQLLHVSRLVEDTLEFSRLAIETAALHLEQCDLARVIAAATEAMREEAAGRRQTLTLEQADDSIWLNADPTRLQQVFSNLLSNALRYTPAGGTIRVTVDTDAGFARIAVQDDGRGIAADQLAGIFQPFKRAATDAGGLGIGLALVQRIVGLHGGRVTAQSAGVGKGTLFTVLLPRVDAG
jgi:signal transduction histidine kinase